MCLPPPTGERWAHAVVHQRQRSLLHLSGAEKARLTASRHSCRRTVDPGQLQRPRVGYTSTNRSHTFYHVFHPPARDVFNHFCMSGSGLLAVTSGVVRWLIKNPIYNLQTSPIWDKSPWAIWLVSLKELHSSSHSLNSAFKKKKKSNSLCLICC